MWLSSNGIKGQSLTILREEGMVTELRNSSDHLLIMNNPMMAPTCLKATAAYEQHKCPEACTQRWQHIATEGVQHVVCDPQEHIDDLNMQVVAVQMNSVIDGTLQPLDDALHVQVGLQQLKQHKSTDLRGCSPETFKIALHSVPVCEHLADAFKRRALSPHLP